MPIYMKFDGIDGESHSQGHEGWIEVNSFSWGVSNSSTGHGGAGGGGSVGKASLQDLHFTTQAGKGSPKLFLACCQGKHFATIKLECSRTGGERENPFEAITLEDCLISSFQAEGDGG